MSEKDARLEAIQKDARLEEILRKSERIRIAAWIRSQREDDTDRPRVQVYDVLADAVERGEHWR